MAKHVMPVSMFLRNKENVDREQKAQQKKLRKTPDNRGLNRPKQQPTD